MIPVQTQRRPQQLGKTPQQIRSEVVAFLPQIPSQLMARTYHVKKATGRHCTLVALNKYTRELYTATYKTPYEALPVGYQNEIESMVSDSYYGMKEARAYE